MDHRPFEDWLLDNRQLNSNEKRQLNDHLRGCPSCSALAEVDLALKSVKMAEPSTGFADLFQVRLASRKKALQRRNFWGFFVLTVSVIGMLVWLAWPIITSFVQSPVNLLASWLTSLASLWANAETLLQGGAVLFKVIPGFIPAYVWIILLLIAGGWSLLWIFSLMKLTKIPRGV
jgi:hypothetical protein